MRSEALGSSFIEGLRASNKRLALAAYEPLAGDGTSRVGSGLNGLGERAGSTVGSEAGGAPCAPLVSDLRQQRQSPKLFEDFEWLATEKVG